MTRIPSRTTTGALKTGKLTPEQEAEAAELRLAFVLEIGRCEVCGYDHDWQRLCVHELPRAGQRRFVKCNRALTLVVCDHCHKRIHNESWKIERQAAYLYLSRPLDFRISELSRWSIRRIQRADVMAIVKEIEPPAAGR